jgi:hypothetical protein
MQACLHVYRYPVSTHVCTHDFCVCVCRIPLFFAFILWYFQVPKVNERNIWNKMRFCMRVLPCIPSPRVTDIASSSSDSVSPSASLPVSVFLKMLNFPLTCPNPPPLSWRTGNGITTYSKRSSSGCMQICLTHRKFSCLSRTGNGNIIQFVCYGTISVLLSSCTLGAIWRAPKRREGSTLWEGRAWMLQPRALIFKSPFHVAVYSKYTS